MRTAKIRPDLRLTFLGPLDMSPVDRAGSVTGMNFALMRNFSPVSEIRKG